MMPRMHARSLVPRCSWNHSPLSSCNARLTCSIVHAGFFPPQPLRVFRHEVDGHQAQIQVPLQRHVVPPLEVPEP